MGTVSVKLTQEELNHLQKGLATYEAVVRNPSEAIKTLHDALMEKLLEAGEEFEQEDD